MSGTAGDLQKEERWWLDSRFVKTSPLGRLCIWSLCCDGALQHPFLSTQAHSLRQTARLVEAAQGSILASERCCPELAAGKWLDFSHVITLDLNQTPSLSLKPSFLLFHPSLPQHSPSSHLSCLTQVLVASSSRFVSVHLPCRLPLPCTQMNSLPSRFLVVSLSTAG